MITFWLNMFFRRGDMDEIKLDVEEQGKVARTGSPRSDKVMMITIVPNFRIERFSSVSSVWASILSSFVQSQWSF